MRSRLIGVMTEVKLVEPMTVSLQHTMWRPANIPNIQWVIHQWVIEKKKKPRNNQQQKKNPHWTHLHSKIHNQFKVKWFINKRNRSGKWKRTRVTQRNFIPSINQQSNTYKASSRIIFKWSLNTYRHYPFHVFKL